MYQGKHNNASGRAPRRSRSRTLLAALALVLVLGLAIGGTIAYLFANTDPITNTFTPGSTTPEIEENVENGTKKSIVIKNTGNVEAYIRVMLVGNTVETVDGQEVVTGSFDVSKRFTYDSTNWIKIGDYYYYKSVVAANNGETGNLLGSSTIKVEEGETVTVLAQSIQAKPTSVVQDTWKVALDGNGNITGGSN